MLSSLVLASALISCPPLSLDGFKALASKRDETKIIFFASWCSSCKEHLLGSHPDGTILVATFDERAAAEKAVTKIGVALPCYSDDGISEFYGVKSLPAQVVVGRDAKPRQATKK